VAAFAEAWIDQGLPATAAPTPPRLDHESFAVHGPRALLGSDRYAIVVDRLAIYASFPHSVILMQLPFTSFLVIDSRRDLHPQVCAQQQQKSPLKAGFFALLA
jgi:hypothetical protein